MLNSTLKLLSKERDIQSHSFKEAMHLLFIKEKLNNPLGLILLAMFAVLFSVVIGTAGELMAAILFAAIVGLPILLGCLFNLHFGIAVALISSFFLMYIKKFFGDAPVGIVLDVLTVVMFFGMFIQQIKVRDWSFFKNPVSIMVFIWIFYNLLMFLNPVAASRAAWFYSVRSMAGLIVLFFIMVYAFNSLKAIERILKLAIFMSLLAALYALYQEFVGMPGFEMKWLHSDPRIYQLVYQWGRIRKFSFLSDPSTFGITMAYMGMFCVVLATGPFSKGKRFTLFILSMLMFLTMVYSGTRTSYVLLPAGFVFFAVLTMRKFIIISIIIFLAAGSVLMIMPTSNPNLYRVQSAFKPGKDESMQYRLENQALIQPYIRSHPIGGGLGSTGRVGQKFSPNSFLAGFPPDSGYVKIAIELGWIGLLIYCSLLFVVFYVGIKNYVRVKDPKIRTYYIGLLVVLYAMAVSHYPQDSIIMLPTSIIFYISLAALVKLKDFDKGKIKAIS